MSETSEQYRGYSLESIKEIDLNDIKKKHLVDVLYISCFMPERLPVAVSMLEKIFRKDLPEEYFLRERELFEVCFKNINRNDKEQYLDATIKFSIEKFGILMDYIRDTVEAKHVCLVLDDKYDEGIDKEDSDETEQHESEEGVENSENGDKK